MVEKFTYLEVQIVPKIKQEVLLVPVLTSVIMESVTDGCVSKCQIF